jgi:hypothetical protein
MVMYTAYSGVLRWPYVRTLDGIRPSATIRMIKHQGDAVVGSVSSTSWGGGGPKTQSLLGYKSLTQLHKLINQILTPYMKLSPSL